MANLFSDGFEGGNLNAWNGGADTDGGDLAATTAAKLHGNYGLACLIDDTTSIAVWDSTPTTAKRYRIRFYFDPHTITMGTNGQLGLFRAMGDGWDDTCYVMLQYTTVYTIYILNTTDTTYSWSSNYTITDAPHCIEMDWKASTAPGANNGFMSLWIDGVLQGTIANIDNDTKNIGFIGIGAQNVSSGISGTFFLDDFASNNDGSEIGVIAEAPAGNAIMMGINL